MACPLNGKAERRPAATITPYLAANALGAVGFAILLAAPLARRRDAFLAIDLAGLAPVLAHYVWLSSPAGAAYSFVYMLADVTAWRGTGAGYAVALRWTLRGLTVVLLLIFYAGPWDLAATAGTLAALEARRQPDMTRLRLLVIASCAGWFVYGAAVGSVAQMAFSCIYALSSGLGVLRGRV